MTVDNINNVASPVSPISPLNPNSVVNQVTTAPLIQAEPVIAQEVTALTTITEVPSTSVATVQSTTMTSVTEVKQPTATDIKAPEVPKGKELVLGFGIVMSLQLINSGYNIQQQQIQEGINLIQELDYGRDQEFTLSLFTETDVGDRFDSINRNRWTSLLRNNPLQRLAEYD